MHSRMRLELLGLVACLAGCGSSTPTTAAIVRPTLIAVVPSEVFPTLPCSETGGEFTGYVATLRDVTPGVLPDGGTLDFPSSTASGPTPCNSTTTFSYLVVGHYYVADVDAYDRTDLHVPSTELDGSMVPVSGSRVLLDPQGQPVAPTRSARCGYTAGGFDAPDASVDGGIDGGTAGAGGGTSDAGDAGAVCLASDYQPPGVLALATLTRHASDCVDAVSLRADALGWTCGGADGIAALTIDTVAKDAATTNLNSCQTLPCGERAVLRVQSLEQLSPDLDAGTDAGAASDGGADAGVAPDGGTVMAPSVRFTVSGLSATGTTLKKATCTIAWSRGVVVPVAPADCSELPLP